MTSDLRRRRYPIPFVFEAPATDWLAVQPFLFLVEPLRLIISEPSPDARVTLEWEGHRMGFGWPGDEWAATREEPSKAVHSRALTMPVPFPARVWTPGAPARLTLSAGRIGGAALVVREYGQG
jgi:hypothetical protein